MKKRMMAIYALAGALAASPIFTSCVDENESASVENVRDARAEQMKSWAALMSAQSEADRIKAEAEVAYKKAETDFLMAQANGTAEDAAMAREAYALKVAQIKAESEMEILLIQQKKNKIEKSVMEAADNYLLRLYAIDCSLTNHMNSLKSSLSQINYYLNLNTWDPSSNLEDAKDYCTSEIDKYKNDAQQLQAFLKDLESIDQQNLMSEEEFAAQLKVLIPKLVKTVGEYDLNAMNVLKLEQELREKLYVAKFESEEHEFENINIGLYFDLSQYSATKIYIAGKEPYKYVANYYHFMNDNDFYVRKQEGNQKFSWFYDRELGTIHIIKGELTNEDDNIMNAYSSFPLFSVKSKTFHDEARISEGYPFENLETLNSYQYLEPDEAGIENFKFVTEAIDKEYADDIVAIEKDLAEVKKAREELLAADKDADVSDEDDTILEKTEMLEQLKKEKESFKQLLVQVDAIVAMTSEDSPEMKEYMATVEEVTALFEKIMEERANLIKLGEEEKQIDYEFHLLLGSIDSIQLEENIRECKQEIEFVKKTIQIYEDFLQDAEGINDIVKGLVTNLEEQISLIQKLIDANQAEIKRVLEAVETK